MTAEERAAHDAILAANFDAEQRLRRVLIEGENIRQGLENARKLYEERYLGR